MYSENLHEVACVEDALNVCEELTSLALGFVLLSRQSYGIQIVALVDQTGFRSGNILDLKNPFFR